MNYISDQHIDLKALKLIEIAKAKALLEEKGLFVAPEKRK